MNDDFKIEFPSVANVESLRPYIDWVIRALGHDPDHVWVSDESHLGDFAEFTGPWWSMDHAGKRVVVTPRDVREDWYAWRHNKRLLARLRRLFGMPVVWRSSIVEVARRLRDRNHKAVVGEGVFHRSSPNGRAGDL